MQRDAEIIDISLKQYRHFIACIHSLGSSANWSFDLFRCRDSVRSLSAFVAATFPAVAPRIERLLDDSGTGLVALDVPSDPGETDNTNVVAGAGLILGLFGNLGPPRMDGLHRPSFTFHMTTHRHGARCAPPPYRQAAARAVPRRPAFGASPALCGAPAAPRTVALFNLHLAHPDPGKFIWVPAGCRGGSDAHGGRGGSGALPGGLDTRALAMDHAVAGNRFELVVEQKERRAIVFRNTAGSHARDPRQVPVRRTSGGEAFIQITDGPANAA